MPSEPPHSQPMVRSARVMVARGVSRRSAGAKARRMVLPFSMLFDVPPASWMKKLSAGRPEGADNFGDAGGLGVFAAEADGENGADIGMAAEGEHEADGVVHCRSSRGSR